MKQPIVYTSLTSPFGRSVHICLNERGIPHDIVESNRAERQVPEHLARHPFAKVPVLEHDSFVVYETQAIIRYVADVFPGYSLVPTEPRLAARMNQVIGIIDSYFFAQVCAPIAGARVFAKMTGTAVDEEKVQAQLPKAFICVGAIDAILDDQPYMAGDAISLADFMAAPHFALFAETPEGETVLAEYPRVRRWLDVVSARDSFLGNGSPI